jgi:hypothetical protein
LIAARARGRRRGEHRVDVLDEVERLAVEQHVLLLDAERVRVALSERVVEDAAAGREAGALPGDGRRVDLLVVSSPLAIASASISTSHARFASSLITTNALAGEIWPKTSTCARATSSKMSVRVRTRACARRLPRASRSLRAPSG